MRKRTTAYVFANAIDIITATEKVPFSPSSIVILSKFP